MDAEEMESTPRATRDHSNKGPGGATERSSGMSISQLSTDLQKCIGIRRTAKQASRDAQAWSFSKKNLDTAFAI